MGKKFYWLKLKNDFFEDDTIRFIEEQENGIAYVNFYLKLCLKALKTEGKLIRVVGETLMPYDVKSLAKLTNVDCDTVAVAMRLFEQIGLIKLMDTGELFLSQINELIGSETSKAELMRIKRAKEKDVGNNVTKLLPKCSKNVTQSIEIENRDEEIDIDIDNISPSSDEEAEPKPSSLPLSPSHPPADEPPVERVNYKAIQEHFNHTCKSFSRVQVVSDSRKRSIKKLVDKYGLEMLEEVFRKAEASDFLTGKSKEKWRASFDWILNETNFIKILEGNYDNKKPPRKEAERNKTDYSQIYRKQATDSG